MHKLTRLTGWIQRHRGAALALLLLTVWVSCARIQPRHAWDGREGPVMPHDTFPGDCSLCHKGESWNTLNLDFSFDHEKETGVALSGAHETAQCLRCHNDRGPVAQFTARGCAGCHIDKHQGRLGINCTDCHDELSWRPTNAIASHNRTRFPLIGAHAATECQDCHSGAQSGDFSGLDVSCFNCHLDDFQSTKTPDHAASGFSTSCQECHSPITWQGATVAHPNTMPLNGGHGGLNCSACHVGDNFQGLSTDCVACHMSDFQKTNKPNHAASGFGTNCKQCHSANTWQGATFNHTNAFPLNGGHGGQDCTACHVGGNFQGLSSDCVSCHMTDFQGTNKPNHAASGFSTDCKQCHATNTWQGATFDHPNSFRLNGGHSGQNCSACHVGGNFQGLSTDCIACHLPEYQGTNNPNHAASGFSTDCKQCHGINTWQGATFDHPNSFRLNGGHSGQSCSACHVGGNFQGLSTDCIACHLPDFQGTNSPNHAASGFSTDCRQCHGTNTWQGATFDHPNSMPLNGGHSGLNCTACHVGGNFQGLSTDCITCHLPDFQGTNSPNHAASGFSTDCKQCHSTNSWQGATFSHPNSFALNGGHSGLNCSACHVGGNFQGLSTDCVACHLSDFQSTSNPNHAASGFSTDCTQCHSGTNTWQGATFSHPNSFRLNGGHSGLNCTACHVGGNFQGLSTDCVTCHLSDFQSTNSPNHAASGFSTDCTQCHNGTNTWQGATFNHTFPITSGDHKSLNCNDCHLNPANQRQFSCTHCHEHTQSKMNDKHDGVGGFSWSSQACLSCHPDGRE